MGRSSSQKILIRQNVTKLCEQLQKVIPYQAHGKYIFTIKVVNDIHMAWGVLVV